MSLDSFPLKHLQSITEKNTSTLLRKAKFSTIENYIKNFSHSRTRSSHLHQPVLFSRVSILGTNTEVILTEVSKKVR